MNSQDLNEFTPGKISAQEDKMNTESHYSPRSYWQLISTGKGKINFLLWRDTGQVNHTQGKT